MSNLGRKGVDCTGSGTTACCDAVPDVASRFPKYWTHWDYQSIYISFNFERFLKLFFLWGKGVPLSQLGSNVVEDWQVGRFQALVPPMRWPHEHTHTQILRNVRTQSYTHIYIYIYIYTYLFIYIYAHFVDNIYIYIHCLVSSTCL